MRYLQKLVHRSRLHVSERLLLPLRVPEWGEFDDPFTNSIYVQPEWPGANSNKFRPAPIPAAADNNPIKSTQSGAVSVSPPEDRNELVRHSGYEPFARKPGQQRDNTQIVSRQVITDTDSPLQQTALQPGQSDPEAPQSRRSIEQVMRQLESRHHRWGKPPATPPAAEIPVSTKHEDSSRLHDIKPLLTPLAPAPASNSPRAAIAPEASRRRKAARPVPRPPTVRIGRLTVDVVPVNDKLARQPSVVRKNSGKKNRQRAAKLRSVSSSAFGIGQM